MTTQVQTEMIADGSVTTTQLADSAVATAKVADSAITTGKLAASAVTPAKLSQPMTVMTSQSASGTSFDFTGIPSWARKVIVTFNGVSISGTSAVMVQAGTSGGVVTSGYLGAVASTTGGTVTALSAGFLMTVASAGATATWYGSAALFNHTGNVWVENGAVADPVTLSSQRSAGSISLAGALDRIRITTLNGTDTFDAGTVNVAYEG